MVLPEECHFCENTAKAPKINSSAEEGFHLKFIIFLVSFFFCNPSSIFCLKRTLCQVLTCMRCLPVTVLELGRTCYTCLDTTLEIRFNIELDTRIDNRLELIYITPKTNWTG